MRILMLTNYIIYKDMPVVAGWMQSLAELLGQSSDLEVGIVCMHDGTSEKRMQNNCTLYLVNFRRSKNPLYRIYRNVTVKVDHKKWSEDFLQAIEDFQPDIVHVFGTESFYVKLIPQIKQKVVVHIQGILTSYINAWYPPGGYSKSDLYRYSFRFIDYLKGHTQMQRYKLFKKITNREQSYMGCIRHFMGRTEWDKLTTLSLNNNSRYYHVEEVLRPQFYNAKKWEYKDSGKLRLISVISPNIYKGFDLILKSASILKKEDIDFEWVIGGTKESDNIVRFFDKKLKLNHRKVNIRYIGEVGADDIIKNMQHSHIFVHPSYIENSPNSVCEAQILGMPVIATNVGGVSSLIENEETGILVPANDPYYLSMQIIGLKTDKELAVKLSNNAREAALKRHNRDKIVNDIKCVYQEILMDKV